MATRSNIGIMENDKIRYIYCHFDGYPDNNGRILIQNYNNVERVKGLIAMGGLSSLQSNINYSIFYHRDRRDDLKIYEANSIKDMITQQYNYIFIDNIWYVFENNNYHLERVDNIIKEMELQW